jgi:hypothetical protein
MGNRRQQKSASSSARPREVDIVVVFDTTGSMGSKIEALSATCGNLIAELDQKQLCYRVGLVAFGDLTVSGDTIKKTGMTRQLPVFQEMLKKIPRNSGGANDGESSFEAIMAGTAMFRPLAQAVRVIIVITDEPALNSYRAGQIIQALQQEEIITFCVAPDLPYFREMATKTGGCWLPIGANTSLDRIKAALLSLSTKIAAIASDVYHPELGNGSVKQYLALTAHRRR